MGVPIYVHKNVNNLSKIKYRALEYLKLFKLTVASFLGPSFAPNVSLLTI